MSDHSMFTNNKNCKLLGWDGRMNRCLDWYLLKNNVIVRMAVFCLATFVMQGD
jgi:hypothetical protein